MISVSELRTVEIEASPKAKATEAKAQAKTIFRNLLDVSATVQVGNEDVIVTLDKRAHNPYLVASGLADHPTPMPWFGNKAMRIKFS